MDGRTLALAAGTLALVLGPTVSRALSIAAQEGPSGPIEAKRILLLRALPMQRTRVTFEMDPSLMEALGFCATPPLLLDHRPSHDAAAEDGRTSAPPVAIG